MSGSTTTFNVIDKIIWGAFYTVKKMLNVKSFDDENKGMWGEERQNMIHLICQNYFLW